MTILNLRLEWGYPNPQAEDIYNKPHFASFLFPTALRHSVDRVFCIFRHSIADSTRSGSVNRIVAFWTRCDRHFFDSASTIILR